MKKALIIISLICLMILSTACPAAPVSPPPAPEQAPLEPAPAEPAGPLVENQPVVFPAFFSAVDIYGNAVDQSIFSEYDLTMINIWGTYCGPCIIEMPGLGEMSAAMPKGTQLLGLVCDAVNDEYIELAIQIAEGTAAAFTHIVPDEALFGYLYDNIAAIPTTIFVDSDGKVVGEPLIGSSTRERYEAELAARLALLKEAEQ